MEEQLPSIIFDLFVAGTDTTATTLRWALLLLSMHQQVQCQLHAQIDKTIGQTRLPSMNDRRVLPLVDAVLEETARVASLVPQNVQHKTTEDIHLCGFDVPRSDFLLLLSNNKVYMDVFCRHFRNTIVLTNIYAIHHDPAHFPEPNTFKPERFLEDGRFQSHSHVMPFSMGKRSCLGESLARMELFLFLTAILQVIITLCTVLLHTCTTFI